ncbi:Sm-like ribonucleoprotein [Polychaeton citri CBS 116435]|uniref:Sm protein B n=1 Tax=Polychaeton citri CBS 116435 TaxID=1314669 RepID=A0A9P4UUC0_9PEZI|nr:Sm-like ribonucleoprotein [Polychaeton citri CBS 116435]
MAATNKQGKMQGFINYRMRATLSDGRQLVGQMLAFDKHMNLVLADCEEFRRVKRKSKAAPGQQQQTQQVVETEEKRMLGLAIVRGANVVSCSVDGPPPADPAARLGTSAPGGGPQAAQTALQSGPGISRPAGRGAGPGLQGPAAGMGGPGFPGFPGRGAGPPGFPPIPGAMGGPPGFGGPPPGFQPPPGGRGFAPPGFGGR